MIDCMIDLETVGNKPGCGILSIGAVFFDPFALDQSKPVTAQAALLVRQGTYHNALDDAKSQAEHAVRLVHHLKLKSV